VNLFCHLPCNWFSNRTLNALTAANTAPNVYTRNHICADISQSMRAAMIGEKVAELVKSLKLSAYWEQSVRRPTQSLDDGPNPETERKEIHNTIRLIRENYERGLYEAEEYIYLQKANALKEKLDLLNIIPETTIERAARTLLDVRVSREWATNEERRDLVCRMIQEVGVDVAAKLVAWVKARRDFALRDLWRS
jgi:hypothetical protein